MPPCGPACCLFTARSHRCHLHSSSSPCLHSSLLRATRRSSHNWTQNPPFSFIIIIPFLPNIIILRFQVGNAYGEAAMILAAGKKVTAACGRDTRALACDSEQWTRADWTKQAAFCATFNPPPPLLLPQGHRAALPSASIMIREPLQMFRGQVQRPPPPSRATCIPPSPL